jgi:enolase
MVLEQIKLGANAILGVSLVAKAAANELGCHCTDMLVEFLQHFTVPMMNIINGGLILMRQSLFKNL